MLRCRICSLFLVICFVFFISSISIADNLTASIETSMLWGRAYDVAVSGDYAYYCKYYGLEVVNISDPLNRSLTARLFLDCGASHIDISGQYAYISGRWYTDEGLRIVNISNPESPQLVANIETTNHDRGVLFDSDIVYVWQSGWQENPAGITLIDVSDPTSPSIISTINTLYHPAELIKIGDFIFVTELESGLQIFNVSNPAAPTWVKDYSTAKELGDIRYHHIEVSGDVIFISDYSYPHWEMAGIHIVNMGNPYSPKYVTTIEMHQACDLVLNGSTLFARSSYNKLYAIDISDLANPVFLTEEFPILFSSDMKVTNGHLLACSGKNEIYDISDPTNITLISEDVYGDNNHNVCVSGNYAFMAQDYSGMTIIDITDPLSPQIVSNYPTFGRAHSIKIIDGLAYLTSAGGLDIINISDPLNPTMLGRYLDADSTSLEQFTIIDNLAYLTACPHGFDIVDVSDPTDPTLIGTYIPEGDRLWDYWIEDVNVFGNYAYMSNMHAHEVEIINISDPFEPIKVGSYTGIRSPVKTSFIDGYALFSGGGVTDIADISDPINPQALHRLNGSSQHEPTVYNDFLIFPGELNSGVATVFNIQDITKPYFVGEFAMPGRSKSIVPFNNYFLVADSYALLVVSLTLPTYLAGDANNDRSVNVGDAVYLVNTVFKGGPPPQPLEAGDSNCDGEINVGDAVNLINYIFKGGDPPCYN
ncbi:MAG: dockerin type I domain-containing protein [candidate division Zixibacteria bacterium]